MREGSLEAPIRHLIDWQNPDFTDPQKLDEEMRRVFDICHGCRRCFNLCDSFPRLFDLVDQSSTGELDGVNSQEFPHVVEACTMCDMCYMTKCPYVPPHEFNLDFPHLMLRYRYAQRQVTPPKIPDQLAQIDRNSQLAAPLASIVNWGNNNKVVRKVLEKTVGIDARASLPKFHAATFVKQARQSIPEVNKSAPGFGRKAVIYATCFGNYHHPELGMKARQILAHNGVETEVVYPGCCGMPQLEQGNLAKVAEQAKTVANELKPWIEKGYQVIALIPSCALMLKSEWPLIIQDSAVQMLSQSTRDICQYLVDLAHQEGLMDNLRPLGDGITLHMSCHSRAQNMGQKAAELLRLIPNTKVDVIERCSGHGGSWGVMVDHFEIALKVGKPVVRQAEKNGHRIIASECPLAADHIHQGLAFSDSEATPQFVNKHPIELLAESYGF
jgi:glycerol-3-phosphate dehydrogenase subunit C